MQREGLLTVFAVALFVSSALAPVGTLSYLPPRTTWAESSSVQAALSNGETEQLTVTVSDDSCVADSVPDTNFNTFGSLFVGMEPYETIIGRSWLKFNLSHVPDTVRILSAEMFVQVYAEYESYGVADRPIGSYYSANDTWKESTITWNTAPTFSSSPSYVISSPPSPNMFVPFYWYSWDVTADVRTTIAGDKILTEVLKVVNESEFVSCFKYFYDRESLYFNASYLALTYTTPVASSLAVDGYSTVPHIDYIMDSAPDLSWQFSDSDSGDIQKGYDLDVYEGTSTTGIPIWQTNTTELVTIYSGAASANARPFATSGEMRYQMKIPKSMLSRTGVVDKLYIQVTDSATVVLQDLSVAMLSVSSSADLGSTFASNYEGLTPVQVLYNEEYSVTITDSWLVIDVQNTFVLSNRSNLLIELRFMDNIGDFVNTFYTTASTGASVAYTYGAGAYTSTTAGVNATRTHNIKIEFASTEVFAAGIGANSYPFNWATAKMQFKYNKSIINTEGYIDRILFGVNELDASATLYNLTMLLVETPVEGILYPTFSANYGGVTPTVVLQETEYRPTNLGQWLVFDVANSFYYSNSHDLLIEISFDSRAGDGMLARYKANGGGYRSWNMTDSHGATCSRDAATYELNLDMIHSEQQLMYGGSPLVNGTTYYFQAKVCDSTGVWSSFSSLVFRYQAIHGVPTWGNLTVTPSPVVLGQPVTVSIDVEYFLGVNNVLIEYGGSNYSMLALGVVYSHTWTPSAAGVVNFTIYMESFTRDWDTASGSFEVQQGGFDMTLLIVGGVAAAAVVVVVLLLYSRRKK